MAVNYDNKLDEFISVAESHMGEGNSWVCNVTGIPSSYPWCCAFVDACAITASISSKIIYTGSWSCGELASQSVSKGYGTWIDGPWKGASGKPTVGDMVLFRWNSSGYTDSWYCDHIGIVKGYSDGTVTTVEGNKSHAVGTRTFSDTYGSVFGYYHPDWSKVGVTDIASTAYGSGQDLGTGGSSSANTGSIFTYENTREDAMMREVSYWKPKKAEPTLDKTDLRCSVINYTTVLGTFLSGAVGSTSGSTDVSGVVNDSAKTIISYLSSSKCGFNDAAACAVCGNIYRESGYNPASVGDNGTSFGLCQWHYDRGSNMKSYVGSNWSSNVSGQLDFLMYELKTSYSGVYNYLKALSNTLEGAKSGADYFVRHFEMPNDVDNESTMRQDYAAELWNQLVVIA